MLGYTEYLSGGHPTKTIYQVKPCTGGLNPSYTLIDNFYLTGKDVPKQVKGAKSYKFKYM